jgi:hypothetical protein
MQLGDVAQMDARTKGNPEWSVLFLSLYDPLCQRYQ